MYLPKPSQAPASGSASELGTQYLPETHNVFKGKKDAQDAHEAIRPTDAARTPESIARYLSDEQLKLYTLIWRRFVASQMAPALLAVTAGQHRRGKRRRTNGPMISALAEQP